MMAAVLYGKEHLQVEPVSIPKIDDGDILVQVRVALTCGTDVKVFRRGYHARMIVPPAVFGHELAGDVVAVGQDVKAFKVGERVVAANSAPCEECFFCRRGVQNLCEALLEPLACVLKGFEETAPRPGDTIAILGLGPIGLMFVRLARLYGCRVIAIGRRRTQLDRAEAMGAHELVRADQHANTVEAVRNLTGGRGADIAVEAVGKPETWHWVLDMVRRGGTLNFFGGCPNDSRVMFDTNLLHYSEITGKASFHHTPAYIRKALDLVTRGDITSRDFVNSEEPLANLLEVMRHLMSHNGHLKTAIIP